ncbi:uncharacterized protein BKA55DRAFT_598563 [Fusarium redolens]|uniref:Uncharacterized protein n=1 Tax=Fusarium redolens TaxID=48865 RepID=A0A9P9G180_FUSRE|nr:uncharacterized protein BKA55DRAFT_598563 [Fusarium redolens]KAH7231274.1 hypothetical protein BKA55DRAFT_598563 [Fusarium redolens]
MDYELNPNILCAENISFLFLLHGVPSMPKTSPIDKDQIPEAGYNLPFDKERGLASTLAFLSSIRDDPNRIPALCIESIPGVCALKVHLAVNKKGFDDSNTDLLEMKLALSRILASLSQHTENVCAERILSRLRLRPSNKQNIKKPMVETLSQTVDALRKLHRKQLDPRDLVESASTFEVRANEAVKLITAWTKHQTTTRLRELVKGVHKMWTTNKLHELLYCIPNNLIDPSLRISLYNIICKVARYREAARYLCRMAKRYPALRRAEVVSVTLQRQMFARVEVNHHSPSLSTTLRRIASKHHLSANSDRIYSLLKLGKDEAEHMFSDQVRRALKGAKIHAEIQLFYHIEALRLTRPPRVVCSSKDACYLCDYFITTITKLHSPKCHGRLYPGWRLPASSVNDKTMRKFNHALEAMAGNSVRDLFRQQRKFRLPDPLESTILTIRRSVSTLASVLTSPRAVETTSDNTTNTSHRRMTSEEVKQRIATLPTGCSEAAGGIPEYSVPVDDTASIMEIATPMATSDQIQMLPYSDSEGETYNKLGMKPQRKLIAGCVPSDDATCVRVGPLRLYVEYSAFHNGNKEYPHNHLKFDVEWMTDINDELVQQDGESSVIDIEKSTYTASLPPNCLNQLDINYRGQVFKVRLHP